MDGASIHGGCVLVGEAGVLIRGPSGSGKSRLARGLVARAASWGLFARLVADDRVRIEALHGRLVARPHPEVAGWMEVWGVGLVAAAHEPAAVLRLVVDCRAGLGERLPAPEARTEIVAGVALPCLAGPADADLADLILWRLSGGCVTLMAER